MEVVAEELTVMLKVLMLLVEMEAQVEALEVAVKQVVLQRLDKEMMEVLHQLITKLQGVVEQVQQVVRVGEAQHILWILLEVMDYKVIF